MIAVDEKCTLVVPDGGREVEEGRKGLGFEEGDWWVDEVEDEVVLLSEDEIVGVCGRQISSVREESLVTWALAGMNDRKAAGAGTAVVFRTDVEPWVDLGAHDR